jgi:hypothetical protein
MVVSRILDGFYVIYGIPKNVTFKYLKSLAKANGFELKRPTSSRQSQQLQGGEVNVIQSLLQIITLFVAHLLYEKTLLAAARQKPQQKVVLHHSPSPVHLLLLDSLASPSPSGKSQVSPVSPAPSGPAFTSLLPFPLAVATEESEDEGEGDEDGEAAADATILKTLVGSVVQVVNTTNADQENINPGNPGLRHREDAVQSLLKRAEPEISRVAVMIARLEEDKRKLEERQKLEIQQGSGSRSRTILGGRRR